MSTRHEKGLSELEKLLASLPPRPTTLDRDYLLFRAGQASMSRSWVWPFAAVIMSVSCGCLGMILVLRPRPEPVVRIVYAPAPKAAANESHEIHPAPAPAYGAPSYSGEGTTSPVSYWAMQQQALLFGAEGLPEASVDPDDMVGTTTVQSAEISAGTRQKLTIPSSLFLFGEP